MSVVDTNENEYEMDVLKPGQKSHIERRRSVKDD